MRHQGQGRPAHSTPAPSGTPKDVPDPAEGMAHFVAGIELPEQRQLEEAIAGYDGAIRLNPKYVDSYNNRGSAYNNLGQYQRAIQDLDVAIPLNPQGTDVYNNRANAYADLGQYLRDSDRLCHRLGNAGTGLGVYRFS